MYAMQGSLHEAFMVCEGQKLVCRLRLHGLCSHGEGTVKAETLCSVSVYVPMRFTRHATHIRLL